MQMQQKTKQVKAWYEEDDLSTDDSRKTLFVWKEKTVFSINNLFGWVSLITCWWKQEIPLGLGMENIEMMFPETRSCTIFFLSVFMILH